MIPCWMLQSPSLILLRLTRGWNYASREYATLVKAIRCHFQRSSYLGLPMSTRSKTSPCQSYCQQSRMQRRRYSLQMSSGEMELMTWNVLAKPPENPVFVSRLFQRTRMRLLRVLKCNQLTNLHFKQIGSRHSTGVTMMHSWSSLSMIMSSMMLIVWEFGWRPWDVGARE